VVVLSPSGKSRDSTPVRLGLVLPSPFQFISHPIIRRHLVQILAESPHEVQEVNLTLTMRVSNTGRRLPVNPYSDLYSAKCEEQTENSAS
jgi:hypothetical protein